MDYRLRLKTPVEYTEDGSYCMHCGTEHSVVIDQKGGFSVCRHCAVQKRDLVLDEEMATSAGNAREVEFSLQLRRTRELLAHYTDVYDSRTRDAARRKGETMIRNYASTPAVQYTARHVEDIIQTWHVLLNKVWVGQDGRENAKAAKRRSAFRNVAPTEMEYTPENEALPKRLKCTHMIVAGLIYLVAARDGFGASIRHLAHYASGQDNEDVESTKLRKWINKIRSKWLPGRFPGTPYPYIMAEIRFASRFFNGQLDPNCFLNVVDKACAYVRQFECFAAVHPLLTRAILRHDPDALKGIVTHETRRKDDEDKKMYDEFSGPFDIRKQYSVVAAAFLYRACVYYSRETKAVGTQENIASKIRISNSTLGSTAKAVECVLMASETIQQEHKQQRKAPPPPPPPQAESSPKGVKRPAVGYDGDDDDDDEDAAYQRSREKRMQRVRGQA